MAKMRLNKTIMLAVLLLISLLFMSCINLGGVSRLELEKTVSAMQTQMDDSQRRLNYLQAYLTAQPRLDIDCPPVPLDGGELVPPGPEATPPAMEESEPTPTASSVPLSGLAP